MASKLQILRSIIAGLRPGANTEEPGTLYANLADKQLGIFDDSKTPVDLLGVVVFSSTAQYKVNDLVVRAGQIYRAKVAVIPATWDATQWENIYDGGEF